MAEDVGNAGMEQMIPLINKLQVELRFKKYKYRMLRIKSKKSLSVFLKIFLIQWT